MCVSLGRTRAAGGALVRTPGPQHKNQMTAGTTSAAVSSTAQLLHPESGRRRRLRRPVTSSVFGRLPRP
jgi:hypothetical protein